MARLCSLLCLLAYAADVHFMLIYIATSPFVISRYADAAQMLQQCTDNVVWLQEKGGCGMGAAVDLMVLFRMLLSSYMYL